MLLMTQTHDLLTDFVDGLISASVQYFETGVGADDPDSGTTQIQFSLGVDQPTVFIEVLTSVAEALVTADPEARNEVFMYVMKRFAAGPAFHVD